MFQIVTSLYIYHFICVSKKTHIKHKFRNVHGFSRKKEEKTENYSFFNRIDSTIPIATELSM